MRRPIAFRLLPQPIRQSIYYRRYSGRLAGYAPLFRAAPLAFARSVRMELVPGDVAHGPIALTGCYEYRLSRRVAGVARTRGGRMIDVGANAGYFSLIWLAGRPDNACVCFEASPRNVGLLERNLAANGMLGRAEVVAAAAGRERGTMSFDPGPAGQTGWGGLTRTPGGDAVSVAVRRVDEAAGAGEVGFMKIDVEGAEAWVLEGCGALVKDRRIPEIWFEVNRPGAEALGLRGDESVRLLRGAGYDVRPLGDAAAEVADWVATAR